MARFSWLSWGLVLMVLCPVVASSFPLEGLDWEGLEDVYPTERKRLEGTWEDGQQWKGTLCNGYYHYRYGIGGDVTDIDLQLNEGGWVDAQTHIADIYGHANGTYRSQATLCVPFRGWVGVAIDSATIRARITFTGSGESLKDMRIRILRTELGTIHLGTVVPAWLERFLTRQINRALAYVWSTQFGAWLSDKITEIIKSKLPPGRFSDVPFFIAGY